MVHRASAVVGVWLLADPLRPSVDSSLEGTMPRTKKATLKRKSAGITKNRTATALKPQAPKKSTTAAGKSRAEGIRIFTLAGRPSKEDFIKVYGPNGPKMTWEQRAEAGVPAEKFQAALAAKQAGR
jgi:hypothetical protein